VGWDQVATILITVVLAVLTGTIYNNRRIDDVHRRIDDLRADMNTRFAQVETQLRELRQELKEEMRQTRSLLQEALKARTP
jgi:cell division protein FtsL